MPNRAQRRKVDKKVRGQAKQKFTLLDFQKALSISLEMKKASFGHLFVKELKEHCLFCGANTETKDECEYWFLTLVDRIQTILINPGFFTDDDIQALWFQHGDMYKDIRLPLMVDTDEKA